MKSINTILVPVDLSPCSSNALRYAVSLADKFGAEIVLMHVVSQDIALDFPMLVAEETNRLLKDARIDLDKMVETALVQANTNNTLQNVPNIHADLSIGAPMAEIVEKAMQKDVDLIIMGTQGEHYRLEKLLGSTSTYVIKNAHCPILVVPEDALADSLNNIGYAADLNEADPFYIWELGKLFTPFHPIINVCHIQLEKEKSHPLDLSDLEDFFANRSPAVQIKFCEDTAETVTEGLNEFADIYGIDLMIIPSPKRGFWANLFRKSTTRDMAFESRIPILVMR